MRRDFSDGTHDKWASTKDDGFFHIPSLCFLEQWNLVFTQAENLQNVWKQAVLTQAAWAKYFNFDRLRICWRT